MLKNTLLKRILSITLSLVLVSTLSGCKVVNNFVHIFYGKNQVAKAEQISHIAFSNGTLFDDSKEIFVEAKELANSETEFSKYNSKFHYNKLTDSEKIIYKALEYAMQESYANILVENDIATDTDQLIKVINYLSLDSPFLEQNIRYETGKFTTSFPVEILGLYDAYAEFKGYYITIKNFAKELYAKKKLALNRAKEIVSSLSPDLTDTQKAEQLFVYVAKNVEYFDYGDDKNNVESYLYDALIEKKTHCDGYANAYSLLLTLVGVENFEKTSTGTEEKEGHTWNFVKLNNNWYNVDCVGDTIMSKKPSGMGPGYYFGYSDILQRHIPDFSGIYPVSEEGYYIKINAILPECTATAFFEAAKNGLRKNNKEFALVVLEKYSKTVVDSQIQRLANYFDMDITYFTNNIINDKVAIMICDDRIV